jgi:7-cyano-7-deazaguanine synthase
MAQNQNRSLLMASGGMDSTVMAYWLRKRKKEVLPLFVNYGQHCSGIEYRTLKKVLPKKYLKNLITVNVSDIYKNSNSRLILEADLWKEKVKAEDLYLPYRNLFLLTIGAIQAHIYKCSDVYAAFINSNHVKEIDCSTRFFNNLNKMLGSMGSIKIKLPFRYLSKTQVSRIGLSLKAPIAETYSCQMFSKVPCGACPNCVDRLTALEKVQKRK